MAKDSSVLQLHVRCHSGAFFLQSDRRHAFVTFCVCQWWRCDASVTASNEAKLPGRHLSIFHYIVSLKA